ncbi:interferon gamma 1-like [Sparus aurata]|uniref:interferon gamma 1-like n=1 Tax=Sparus aurata TaxID=8175 RepID=UPI0011C1AE8D|nr:interferon gamma 1-like [Sparus aurata]
MSSCCGSVSLLVLLGVVFAAGSPARYVSENMRQTHESIAAVLSLKQPEIITNPLFSSVIRSLNTSCQGREELKLMNVTLDIYMRIFSSILHHQHKTGTPALLDQVPDSERSKVKEDLKVIRGKMEALKRHLNHPSHDREDVISKLNMIKVDDPLVQKKALAEFKEVYQAASVVAGRRC